MRGGGCGVQTFDVCFDASQNITNIIDLVIAGYVTYVPCERAFCPRMICSNCLSGYDARPV